MLTPKIYNKLYEVLKSGPFYAFSIDPNTKLLSIDTDNPVSAESIHLTHHEEDLTFSRRAARTRQRLELGVERWKWTAYVRFDAAVTPEAFNRAIAKDIPVIPRDADDDIQVFLEVVECSVKHPAEQNATNGTEMTYVFEAVLTPR